MSKSSKIELVQKQLAIEWKCESNVFKQDKNVFIESSDSFFQMITFGKSAFIRAHSLIYKWCIEHFEHTEAQNIMDGENLYAIEAKLREFGRKLVGEHTRYLYFENDRKIHKPTNYEYRLFDKTNIKELYVNDVYENALNYLSDIIALGAYEGDKLIAVAGADDNLSSLWQIGIDTLPAYRNKGLATYLVKTLADEIEKRGALPYYTTWSANIASTTVAINSGFLPVWVEYYAEKI